MQNIFDLEWAEKDHHLSQSFYKLYQSQGLTDETAQAFRAILYHFYGLRHRSFAWREVISPYRVVVSEVMLQQTQTDRVATKFDPFIDRFPDFASLAQAPFDEVLRLWKGLGYNRRALALQKIAKKVSDEFQGELPQTVEALISFPAIGPATANAILAYAFQHQAVFIETNIRTVIIYFFFKNLTDITDKQLMPIVEKVLDRKSPRDWYYALMDYGVMLKKREGNLSRFSAHYQKQSKFEGSDRQIRGMILQHLLDHGSTSIDRLINHFQLLGKEEVRVRKILQMLVDDEMLHVSDNLCCLKA
jgi:A/G-specific adenine glycosylase